MTRYENPYEDSGKLKLFSGEFVVSMSAGADGYASNIMHKLYAITNWGNLWMMKESRWVPVGKHNNNENINPEQYL